MTIESIITGLQQGLLLSLVAFGIMISFRLIRFADLSAEGAYPFGGAVAACLFLWYPSTILATVGALVAGGFLGLGTAWVHLRFKVNTLLAGIILSTMIYSVDLRLMGKPNIALLNSALSGINIWVLGALVLCVMLPLVYFLLTEYGLRLRAVGYNPDCAKDQGVSVTGYTFLGLFIANAYTGFAGGLMVQCQQYMDIGMGIGIVIHGLAALMIGESVLGNHTLKRQLCAPVVGALIYQQMQGMALSLGCAPSDLKLLTGVIILLMIASSKKQRGLSDTI
jgi:putative tryptophan/tyrosine transport system permease protein